MLGTWASQCSPAFSPEASKHGKIMGSWPAIDIYIYNVIYIYTFSTHNHEKKRLSSMTWIIKDMISKTRFCISEDPHLVSPIGSQAVG